LFYKTKLGERGWQMLPDSEAKSMPSDMELLYFHKENKECFLQFDQDFRTRKITTTIAFLEH